MYASYAYVTINDLEWLTDTKLGKTFGLDDSSDEED